jgi:hypothetical protein
MSKLKIAGKDQGVPNQKRIIQVLWSPSGGEIAIAEYPGDSTIDTNDAGQTTISYGYVDEAGNTVRVCETYNYGEIRKLVEKVITEKE